MKTKIAYTVLVLAAAGFIAALYFIPGLLFYLSILIGIAGSGFAVLWAFDTVTKVR